MLYKFILKFFLKLFDFFPASNSRIDLGQKHYRQYIISKLTGQQYINLTVGKHLRVDWDYFSIGKNSGIGNYAKIEGAVVGSSVLMGEYCCIYRRNHTYSNKTIPIIDQGYSDKPIVVIGDDVWIGDNVTILPGIIINHGAIIGAGSVVTKDVNSFDIVAGNPAKKIGDRNG